MNWPKGALSHVYRVRPLDTEKSSYNYKCSFWPVYFVYEYHHSRKVWCTHHPSKVIMEKGNTRIYICTIYLYVIWMALLVVEVGNSKNFSWKKLSRHNTQTQLNTRPYIIYRIHMYIWDEHCTVYNPEMS